MTGTYHSAPLAFSVLIAIFASYTALALAARVTAAEGRFRLAWLAGGSVALGIGRATVLRDPVLRTEGLWPG